MLAYTNHMQDMPLTESRLYAVVTLDPDGEVGRASDKQRPDCDDLANLPSSEWPHYLGQRDASFVEQNEFVDHSATRQTVSEPGSKSGDTNSLSRDWGDILRGRRSPLFRHPRRRRVESAGQNKTLFHGDSGANKLTMTTDAKQQRVILGNVPKYRQDDEGGGGELQVMPFPGMLIQAFSAVDLNPDLAVKTPTRATSFRAASTSKKLGVSRAKYAGSVAGAKLPKVSGLKRPHAAKPRLAPGETAGVSSRDRKSVIGVKQKLKCCAASAANRNSAVVLNGVYRISRKSEKHKLEVSDLKGDMLKGRTSKQRQRRQQTSSKREQNRTSISTSKPLRRTSFLSGGRPGISPIADLKKNHETHAHAPSLPRLNAVTMIKSALKKTDRPAAPRKSVQFGAEYIREVTKIEYISDEYDDDDASTTVTELSDFSTESITTGSDDSEESDYSNDSEWRL